MSSAQIGEMLANTPGRVKKVFGGYSWIVHPIRFVMIYGAWVAAVRLLTLTLITFFIISPGSRFQDISESFSSNEVSFMGLSALLYVALVYGFNPITATPLNEIITRERIEKSFLPGFMQGTIFSGGLILAFILGDTYRYWGTFIQFDEAPLEMVNVLLRMTSLGVLAYCEEFIFRHRVSRYFEGHIPHLAAVNLVAILYCGIKMLQFDLGWMQLLTLYLISITLSFRAQRDGGFARGAGFWAGILIVFHPLLSLPIFGNDFSGVLLVKHQSVGAMGAGTSGTPYSFFRMISGGAGGPLASFAFQLLLILDIGRSILRRKKPN